MRVGIIFILGILVYCQSGLWANNLSIEVKDWTDEKLPEVKEDADNIEIYEAFSSKPRSTVLPKELKKSFKAMVIPRQSLAWQIEDKSKRYTWKPKWHFKGIGGPRLPSVALSADKSVLAIVETTGEFEGPFGSRILFIETYHWNIIRHVQFKNTKLVKIQFVPGSANLLCWFDRQLVLKQTSKMGLLDCTSGKLIYENDELKERLGALSCSTDGRYIYVVPHDQKQIYTFSGETLESVSKTFTCKSSPSVIAVNFDNSRLAAANEEMLNIFNVLNPDMVEPVKLKTHRPGKQLFYANEHTLVSISDTGNAVLFQGGKIRNLEKHASGLFFLASNNDLFGIGKRQKSELQVYNTDDFSYLYSVFPVKLKPKTRYSPVFVDYLPHYKAFLFLDSGGSLYMVYKPSKRWRKYVIFSPKK